MTRYVLLPEGGFYFQGGPRPESVTVTEVPPRVPDSDLKALVDSLCTGRGLQLGLGEGPAARPAYSRNYRQLLRLAVDRGIGVPASMVKDAKAVRPAGTPKPDREGVISFSE
jgi:hypothetical protein